MSSEKPFPRSESVGLLLSVANLHAKEQANLKTKANSSANVTNSSTMSTGPNSLESNSSQEFVEKTGAMENDSLSRQICDLEGALEQMQSKLLVKDQQILKLNQVRDNIESEMEELSASLFEEAHKMVREANVKNAAAEKALKEAHMKIEGLEVEVKALKALVITSTPSQPNRHLHPQLEKPKKKDKDSPKNVERIETCPGKLDTQVETDERNMDPVLRNDYLDWKKSPTLDPKHPFISRIFTEDVNLCLTFPNTDLTAKVDKAIQENSLTLTPVKDFTNLPRNCALLSCPVLSKYSLVVGEESYHVGQLARNRLIAVCDLINYLRYVCQGLVKASSNDVYWEIMRLRKQMTMARLGFNPEGN